nr:hypothetical protein [Tanacetum cinerariifolium]
MYDEPMWAADRVIAPTPGFAINIPETANEFAIKGNHLTLVKGNQFDGRTKTDPHKHIHEFLGICDMFKYRALFDRLLEEIRAFSQLKNESLTDAWLRMKEMLLNCHGHNHSKGNIIKIFYRGLSEITQEVLNAATGVQRIQSRAKTPDLDDDDMPISREEEAKFMQTFRKTRFYNDYRDRYSNRDNWRSSGRNDYNYPSNTDDKPYDIQKQINDFMKSQQSTNAFVKNHQASIQNLETKFDRLADKQSGRPSRSLPRNTQPNPRGGKAYQPPQAHNEHANVVFTRSGKSYNPPDNLNDQQKETHINFDSEDDEPTPQPKTQPTKSVKKAPLPKPYKPMIPYPQRLRKEKLEAQYGKFLDMIRAIRINVPLIDILAGMPNYGKFLKELISIKHKIEQISATFLSDESSAMIQNKVPPKIGDPGSFLILCNFNKTFSCNALADLGASINLMTYSLYAKPTLETLKPTKMRKIAKFLSLWDDLFFTIIDVIDEIIEEDSDAFLDEGSKILYSIEGTLLEEEIFFEFNEFMAMIVDENSKSESDNEEPPFEKITINTDYKIKTSLKELPMDL